MVRKKFSKEGVTTRDLSLRMLKHAMENKAALDNKLVADLQVLFKEKFPNEYFSESAIRDVCAMAGLTVLNKPRSGNTGKRSDRIRVLAQVLLSALESLCVEIELDMSKLLTAQQQEDLRCLQSAKTLSEIESE